jgi:ethanolamine permease
VVVPWLVGTLAVFSRRTDDLITASVLGAVVVYLISMASLFRLRRTEPAMERPFRALGYPWVPGVAVALSVIALVAVAASAPKVTAGFALGAVVLAATQAFRTRHGRGEQS